MYLIKKENKKDTCEIIKPTAINNLINYHFIYSIINVTTYSNLTFDSCICAFVTTSLGLPYSSSFKMIKICWPWSFWQNKIHWSAHLLPETECCWLQTHPGNLWWTCIPKVVEEQHSSAVKSVYGFFREAEGQDGDLCKNH